jgi:beta-lactamase class A
MEYSDNTAANLLLKLMGGPEALTNYARSIGDAVMRVERVELDLNSNLLEDVRDTTSPAAMLKTMTRLLTGDPLSSVSRLQLERWMVAAKTGAARLRAGFPRDWSVGDKTGSGENGAANDIAIAWPPNRSPVLVAVFFTNSSLARSESDAVLAEVGKIVALEFNR